MTWNQVTAAGAEILDAFVYVPTEGWHELSTEHVRHLHDNAVRQIRQLERGFNAAASQQASLLEMSLSKALTRAHDGGRVFGVQFPDGEWAFAATKTDAEG